MFPPVFDPEIYRSNCEGVGHFADDELLRHYLTAGIHEGQICNQVPSRSEFISLIPRDKKCLEVGPFNRPILTGDNIYFADILGTEDLFNRARELGLDTTTVPEITWVLKDGTLKSIDQTFDLILSSHNIEHQIDLVDHFNEVGRLINSDGYYFLIIPDARYCFDHFLKPSTIADVLDRHYFPCEKHSLKSVIEHRALTTHNDSVMHWNGHHGPSDVSTERVKNAMQEYFSNLENGIDVHAWQFTPESFRHIVLPLYELELVPFSIERIYPTVRNDIEFMVILKKTR